MKKLEPSYLLSEQNLLRMREREKERVVATCKQEVTAGPL